MAVGAVVRALAAQALALRRSAPGVSGAGAGWLTPAQTWRANGGRW
ncbi:hypothetical protein ABZ754_12965 [Micromonospora purpureochromogenes]